MRAANIMSMSVCTASPDMPINEIACLLCDRDISALPVVDDQGRVLGIVSEGDLLRRVELNSAHRSWWLDLLTSNAELAKDFVKTNGRTAKDVMTSPAIVVEEETDVVEIAKLLEAKRIKRVPVVRDGKLVGIVSRADVVRSLIVAGKRWGRTRHVDDDKIRAAVMDGIAALPFVDGKAVNVVVDNGEVHLWGQVESPEQRAAIRVVAENARGVREVIDGLVDWRVTSYV